MRRLVVSLNDFRPILCPSPEVLDQLRAALPSDWEMRVVDAPSDGRGDGGAAHPELLAAVAGAEVFFGSGFARPLFHAATADGAGPLRWVHSVNAGVGGALYPEMRQSPVLLTNSAGIYAEPMADTVLAMMLHFARGLDLAVRAQTEAAWRPEPFFAVDSPVRELADCTVGILGFGGIGRAVARRAAALGMRVVAAKRAPSEPPPGVELVTGPDALRALLPRSDYLVITLPATEQTERLVDADALALLPAGAVVVNVGRGSVVDEEALVRVLRQGRLRGAALDVFREEPLPADSPLWRLPNVLVTPHASGVSHRFWHRQLGLMRENLRRYLNGERLLNLVDKDSGY